MKTRIALIGILAAGFLLTSCSLEKRLYRKGFYVNNSHKTDKTSSIQPEIITDVPLVEVINIVSSFESETKAVSAPEVMGAENIIALVEKQSETRAALTVQANEDVVTTQSKQISKVDSLKPGKKQKKNANASSGGKSQLVALLLCLFVGILGVHRFYLGYIGIGIIQLFTLGGLGIWWLIDLIMIITGGLKPKDGEYDETF